MSKVMTNIPALINSETGEVSEIEKKEPNFVKLYFKNLGDVKGVSGLQMDMFIFMLSNMNDENEVSYGPSSKRRFIALHGTSNASFNNNIKKLISSGLIQRLSKGEFIVNKKYAVKVEWAKVQSIVWTTEYSSSGKVENVEIKQA